MKKIFRLFVSLLICFCLTAVSFVVYADGETIEARCGESYYKTDKLVSSHTLKAGVTHEKYIAYSSSGLSGFNAAGSGGGGLNVPNQLYPQSVNVLNVPSGTGARVVNWTKSSSYGWKRGTVVELAKDFEEKNPGWMVIAAVNGDFFDINSVHALPETTSGAFISNGDVYKTVGSTVIGFTNDSGTNTLIGDKPIEFTDYFILTLYNNEGKVIAEYNIDNVNPTSNVSGLSLYYSFPTIREGEGATATRVYSEATIPNGGYIVKTPIKCIPYSGGDNGSFFGKGIQTLVSEDTAINYNQFGVYSDNQEINQNLKSAATIRVQRNAIGAYADCDNVSGTGNTLVRDGNPVVINDKNRHPRTMIGVKADGTLVLVTVDGRHPEVEMYGMTLDELSAVMYAHGCVAAYNMDGGGSTTVLIRDGDKLKVMNNPSDGNERRDSNAILIVVPEIELVLSDVLDTSLVINAPKNLDDVIVENISVTINNQTFDLVDSYKVENLESKKEYTITYSYDRTYDGVTERINGDPIVVTMGKHIPTISNVRYDYKDNTLKVTFDINDPDEAINIMRLYYNNKNKTITSNEVIIENLTSFDPSTLRIIAPYEIGSITNSVMYITINAEDFKQFEVEEEKKSGCQTGAYVSLMLTSMIGLAYIIIKRK
ncbi:MAG: phosphodiester glycosidase family protein [Bacilli bacterium]|nr:phosphodiester glycosidase family protein [Bacilli bacterium]